MNDRAISTQEIIVIGGGGHAKVIISLIKKIEGWHLLGYLDDENKGKILGSQYLGNDKHLKILKEKHPDCAAAIGVGSVAVSDKRRKIKEHLEASGFHLPALVSPAAVVNEEVPIGQAAVILDGVVVGAGTKIGEGVILNTSCSVDHDCQIGDFVHVAPGVIVSGGVVVGKNCLLSTGCVVIQYRTIADNCLIGAGATVVDDCLKEGCYLGTPARLMPSAM